MQDQTFLWNHFMTMPILIKWITALCIVMHNKVLETLKLILARAYLIFHIKVGQESRTAFINFGWYLTKFGRCVHGDRDNCWYYFLRDISNWKYQLTLEMSALGYSTILSLFLGHNFLLNLHKLRCHLTQINLVSEQNSDIAYVSSKEGLPTVINLFNPK